MGVARRAEPCARRPARQVRPPRDRDPGRSPARRIARRRRPQPARRATRARRARGAPARAAPPDRARFLRRHHPPRARPAHRHAAGYRQDADPQRSAPPAPVARGARHTMTDDSMRESMLESVALYALGVLPREDAALVAAFIANDDEARREYNDLLA